MIINCHSFEPMPKETITEKGFIASSITMCLLCRLFIFRWGFHATEDCLGAHIDQYGTRREYMYRFAALLCRGI